MSEINLQLIRRLALFLLILNDKRRVTVGETIETKAARCTKVINQELRMEWKELRRSENLELH